MVAAVRVHKLGGPEVLTYEEVEVGAPGEGQIRLQQHACGINFIDTYFRTGLYPVPGGLPFIPGNEGAGEVTAVGPGVTDLKPGDRVTYVLGLGGYAVERLFPAEHDAYWRGPDYAPPGGETWRQMYDRALTCFSRIAAERFSST